MNTQSSIVDTIANGHHQHKSLGRTTYDGPITPAPAPVHGDLPAQVAAMADQGYVVMPQILTAAEVQALLAFIDRAGQADEAYVVPKWCFNKHVPMDFTRMAEAVSCIDRSGPADLAEAIHGADCRVIGGSFWVTGPGRAMGIHLDYLPLRLPEDVLADPRVAVPIFVSTAHFYLDDMETSLGPTLVVPGSHRAGRPPENETSWHGTAPQAVMVKAGDVMMFRSDLWHGAALNSGSRRRSMIQVHYANMYIDRPFPSVLQESRYAPEILSALTPRQRRLLGGGPAVDGRGSYTEPGGPRR